MIIILYSGGADSRYMLQKALRYHKPEDITLLHLNYGQKMPEFEAVMRVAQRFGLQTITAEATLPPNPLRGDVPPGPGTSVSPAWVPGRNTVLLALAASWSEFFNAEEIWIGCDRSDQLAFPDCRKDFLDAMERVANAGRDPVLKKVKIVGPVMWLDKDDVLMTLQHEGVPVDEYVSGYPGTEVADA